MTHRETEPAGASFRERVYALLHEIPHGKVVTYGELARAVGNPGAARAVGGALHRNPDPDGIPCFRVVDSAGRLAVHFAFGGIEEQKRRLEADGIPVFGLRVDLRRYGWSFPNEE